MKLDNSLQQIIDLINSGSIQNLLITSGKNVDPDAVGSALGLALALETKVPSITVAIDEFDPADYLFLPGVNRIANSIGQKSLVVSIDIGENPIKKINYNTQDTTFNFVLTPQNGPIDVDQIQYSYTSIQFDAIIVVDTAKKDLLGQWINSFSEELADVPVVNIDHHPDNEQFGTLNYIQPTAPSASAVVFQLIQALELPLSPDMATNLLAGLLSDTSGFANSNSNADTLRLAAQFIDTGANLHQLMVSLFRTLSLPAMKLWGNVLTNIRLEEPGVILTQLSQGEIVAVQATDADVDTLGTLVNNILVADQNAQLAVLLKDKGEGEVSGSMRAIADIDVSAIARQLGGGGHVKAAGFRLTNTTMEEARQQVLKTIQQALTTDSSQAQTSQKDQ